MRIIALVLLVALGFETFAPVRTLAEPIAPGTRIRLTGDWPGGGHWVGAFEAIERDSIWIRDVTAWPRASSHSIGRHAPLPESSKIVVREIDVRSLEVSHGMQSDVARGARIGVLSGIVLGAVLGAASYDPTSIRSRRQVAGTGALVFGALGLIVGGFTGLVTRVEQWEAVPLSRLGEDGSAPADSAR